MSQQSSRAASFWDYFTKCNALSLADATKFPLKGLAIIILPTGYICLRECDVRIGPVSYWTVCAAEDEEGGLLPGISGRWAQWQVVGPVILTIHCHLQLGYGLKVPKAASGEI